VSGYAILGVVINATLFLVGLSLTSVQVAAVLITTIPVFTLAAAILIGGETASAKRIGGIAGDREHGDDGSEAQTSPTEPA